MKSFTPSLCVFFTACVLLVGLRMLTTSRLEYCGRTDVVQPQVTVARVADGPSPTLAPPRKVVFVQVEADKSDLEVAWLNDEPGYRQLTNQ